MDDNRRWLIAWSRFEAFRKNPPNWWDEGAVSEFHDIVDSLEEASGEDLSSFRVPESELKHEIVVRLRATGRRPGRKIMSKKRYVDEQFMHRQIEGIASYFQNLQSPPLPRKIGF
jgi:phage terminase small subunit